MKNQCEIPGYIDSAQIAGAPVNHVWTSKEHFVHDSPAMEDRLLPISFRGVEALSVGISEWIVWRFDGLTDLTDTKQFLEACWAGIIDPLYRIDWHLAPGTKLGGVIEPPLASTCDLLNRLFHLASIKSNGAQGKTVYLAYLARHVLPKKAPFESWLKLVLPNLAKNYPRRKSDLLGTPVPRAALDPTLKLKPADATTMLRDFLAQLHPASNPYLRPPKEMIKLGFQGIPYSL